MNAHSLALSGLSSTIEHMSTPLSSQTVEQLVKQAQQYDEEAFETLFQYFYEPIHRYIYHRSTPEETEDLVSETWLRIIQNIHRYAPRAQASFKSWIFRIAHNKVIDYYRTTKSHISVDQDLSEDIPYNLQLNADGIEFNPEAIVHKKYEAKKLQMLIQKLPSLHREIVELKYLEDFSNQEISHITGKSEGNIRVIQLRALRNLRNELEI